MVNKRRGLLVVLLAMLALAGAFAGTGASDFAGPISKVLEVLSELDAKVGTLEEALEKEFSAIEIDYSTSRDELHNRPYRAFEMKDGKPTEQAKEGRQAELDYLYMLKAKSKAAALKTNVESSLSGILASYFEYDEVVMALDGNVYELKLNSAAIKKSNVVYNSEDETWTVSLTAETVPSYEISLEATYSYEDITGKAVPPVRYRGQAGYEEYNSFLGSFDSLYLMMQDIENSFDISIGFRVSIVRDELLGFDRMELSDVSLNLVDRSRAVSEVKAGKATAVQRYEQDLSWEDEKGMYRAIGLYCNGDLDLIEGKVIDDYGLGISAKDQYIMAEVENHVGNYMECHVLSRELGIRLIESDEIFQIAENDRDYDGKGVVIKVPSGIDSTFVNKDAAITLEAVKKGTDGVVLQSSEYSYKWYVNGVEIKGERASGAKLYCGTGRNDLKLNNGSNEIRVVASSKDGTEQMESIIELKASQSSAATGTQGINWENLDYPEIGEKGPAGGYVFYDKGKYTDGWRYLEAAPADLRVVGGKPTVDSGVSGYSSAPEEYVFGYNRKSYNGSNLYVNGTSTYSSTNCTGTAIGKGETNTEKLVAAMGASAYSSYSGSSKTANYAARLCSELEYNGYDDWFLPSRDELDLMCDNLDKEYIGDFRLGSYWSSSEGSYDANNAWSQNFKYGGQNNNGRTNDYSIRPCRAF